MNHPPRRALHSRIPCGDNALFAAKASRARGSPIGGTTPIAPTRESENVSAQRRALLRGLAVAASAATATASTAALAATATLAVAPTLAATGTVTIPVAFAQLVAQHQAIATGGHAVAQLLLVAEPFL